jgi:hypothetical protein
MAGLSPLSFIVTVELPQLPHNLSFQRTAYGGH